MLAETERLVAIDSGTDDDRGVARVNDALAEILAEHRFEVAAGDAGGLEATLRLGDGPRLLLVGHADTVWPAGTAAQWPPARRDGMLSGPGWGI